MPRLRNPLRDEGFQDYLRETRGRAVVVLITMAIMFIVFYIWAAFFE